MKNKTALKGGTYSIVLTTIVLAILVVVNIFAQALPSSATQYDISSTKLYSIVTSSFNAFTTTFVLLVIE